ncbi:T-cell surface protein tactile [Microtus ochrogaster]|uniref:T-cell surface protein tactile n=1 Tax=Microtus ochrogaster TaxID=79684 RepID=A0A8J6KRF2_MICOH|nr:T-cell surface protein tactile [Microtus ochrogaster]
MEQPLLPQIYLVPELSTVPGIQQVHVGAAVSSLILRLSHGIKLQKNSDIQEILSWAMVAYTFNPSTQEAETGIWEERVNAGETIYFAPGSDVNLTCQTTKEKEFLIQAQWSKVTDKNDPIVVYHPQYGFHYAQGHAHGAQVAFIKIQRNVTEWTLSLKNISTTFSGQYECSFTVYPEGIQTTVYNLVVAPPKPEILMMMENGTMDVLGERVFTCLLKKVFPRANITWLIDGRFLQDNEEGIYITNDKKTDRSGFWEVKSVFTRMHGNRPAQSNNVTVQCMALSPGPRNKMWNISSQVIMLPSDSVNVPTEHLTSVTGSTLGTQSFPNDNVSPTTSRAASSSSASWPSPSVSPPEWLSSPGTSTKPLQPDAPVILVIHYEFMQLDHIEMNLGVAFTSLDVISSTTRGFPDVATTARGMTKNDHNYITSITVNKPRDGMSWPVVVAALLLFCAILFMLGVRKWCQYQKEM